MEEDLINILWDVKEQKKHPNIAFKEILALVKKPSSPKKLRKYDLVDIKCLESDRLHAPFETIEAESVPHAKSIYHMMYPQYKYIDIRCRISRKGSFDL